jgi:hypothetical protein
MGPPKSPGWIYDNDRLFGAASMAAADEPASSASALATSAARIDVALDGSSASMNEDMGEASMRSKGLGVMADHRPVREETCEDDAI